ncbi:MAG: ABC transporter permease subunit [Gammaproteobacteria bacterium]|nr:ABC transporter permease subunit [Gammaproteobacteria bacterium]MCY4210340.1 ABC transporter permease subunit [Gammaproteobacteria bacterium]MCY4283379.1 ABC transporter permease subunit [Gammaproteobacteria bacterium]MCY4339168.1 ABC transporter permease subunit [Gammaproteobacteria bacterium]
MRQALVKLELLRLRKSPVALAVLLFTLLASLYAVWSGVIWREHHSAILSQHEARVDAAMEKWRQTLIAFEKDGVKPPPFFDARPGAIEKSMALGAAPLSHLAIGNTELLPTRLNVSPARDHITMVELYGFENPTVLAHGRFDLSFFLVFVLPLLLIGLSFDVIATDRTRGTLHLLLSYPVSLGKIIAARLLTRTGLLLLLAGLSTCIGIAFSGSAGLVPGALWLLVFLAYSLFWVSAIFFVVSFVKRSEVAVGSLVSLWVLVTLALPALANSAAEGLYPQPSKLAYLSDARTAKNEAWKHKDALTRQFLDDHPELSVGQGMENEYFRAMYFTNKMVLEKTAPIVAALDDSNRRRSELLDTLQFVSPAIIAQRAFFRVAGSDFDTTQRFTREGIDALSALNNELETAILSSTRISVEEYHKLPDFKFEHARSNSVLADILFPVLFLLITSVFLVIFGFAGNRK